MHWLIGVLIPFRNPSPPGHIHPTQHSPHTHTHQTPQAAGKSEGAAAASSSGTGPAAAAGGKPAGDQKQAPVEAGGQAGEGEGEWIESGKKKRERREKQREQAQQQAQGQEGQGQRENGGGKKGKGPQGGVGAGAGHGKPAAGGAGKPQQQPQPQMGGNKGGGKKEQRGPANFNANTNKPKGGGTVAGPKKPFNPAPGAPVSSRPMAPPPQPPAQPPQPSSAADAERTRQHLASLSLLGTAVGDAAVVECLPVPTTGLQEWMDRHPGEVASVLAGVKGKSGAVSVVLQRGVVGGAHAIVVTAVGAEAARKARALLEVGWLGELWLGATGIGRSSASFCLFVFLSILKTGAHEEPRDAGAHGAAPPPGGYLPAWFVHACMHACTHGRCPFRHRQASRS